MNRRDIFFHTITTIINFRNNYFFYFSGIEALRSKAGLPDSWVWEKQVRASAFISLFCVIYFFLPVVLDMQIRKFKIKDVVNITLHTLIFCF